MEHPVIHLNGTSRESLAEGYRAALGALEIAQAALEECAPHGRDYYPQGPQSYSTAASEHRERARHLELVRRELIEIFHQIIDLEG